MKKYSKNGEVVCIKYDDGTIYGDPSAIDEDIKQKRNKSLMNTPKLKTKKSQKK